MHREPIKERMLVDKASQRHIPLSAAFELLPLCNMDCKMCYLRLSKPETDALGGIRPPAQWLDLAGQLRDAGMVFLLLTGGEPFLYPGFLELYTRLRRMGFILTINTNGTLLTEKEADILAENKPRRVNITLYGTDSDMYQIICGDPRGFDRAIRAIRLLRARNIDTKLNVTLVPENVSALDDFHKIAAEFDIPIEVNPYVVPACRERRRPFDASTRLTPEQAADSYVRTLEHQLGDGFLSYIRGRLTLLRADSPVAPKKAMTCRAGRSSAWISWQGNLIPCAFLPEPQINVFDQGFSEAWDALLPQIEAVRLPADCSGCAMRGLCNLCAAFARCDSAGADKPPEFMCHYTEEIIRIFQEKVMENEA